MGVGILVLGAIAPPPSPSQITVNPQVQALRISGIGHAIPSSPATQLEQPLNPSSTLRVAVYTPGTSCDGFISTVITVPTEQPVAAVVHHLLTHPELALMGFNLSGYRVLQTAQAGTVTVDFRLPPQSARQWVSLSIHRARAAFTTLNFGRCEQFLLAQPVIGN